MSGSSAPAGYRFRREVIAAAVRWYLRYGSSYRDVEELLAERGVEVDHMTVYRWAQAFTPESIDAARAVTHGPSPIEVTTDRAPVYLRVLDELIPAARHVTEQYASHRVEADHGRRKARLPLMRGIPTIRSLRTIAVGHAVVQNLRPGHDGLTVDVPVPRDPDIRAAARR